MTEHSFYLGFADATGLDTIESAEQWAAFSRQLSDAEITEIEAGGYDSGLAEGNRFKIQFPD